MIGRVGLEVPELVHTPAAYKDTGGSHMGRQQQLGVGQRALTRVANRDDGGDKLRVPRSESEGRRCQRRGEGVAAWSVRSAGDQVGAQP